MIAVACLSAVKCPLSLTVPLQLTAIFECQSFKTTIFCANTPWPRRLQPTAICVTLYHHNQSILLANQICVLDFYPVLKGGLWHFIR